MCPTSNLASAQPSTFAGGRKRWSGWLLCLIAAATLLAAIAGAGAAPSDRTLIVGSEEDYPPFATGTTDATAGGFTVELWRAVADAQGLSYTIRVRPFDELLQGFKAGSVDVLINLAQSDERRRFADFSVAHVIVGGAIFVRQGDARVGTEDELNGKSVIVIKGDLAHDYALGKGWRTPPVLADTAEQGLRLLASGQHDAMLISKLAGLQTIRDRGIGGLTALDVKVGFSQRFAFAVRKGDAELLARINEGLAVAKANGVYDRLYEKWFGVYEAKPRGWRDVAPWLAVLALVLAGAWAVTFRNRRRRDAVAAAVLRDSEERWKFALEGAGDGVWDADLVAGTTLYSRRWKEILGFRDDEIGSAADEWIRRIHPDDLPRVLRENQACVDGTAEGFVSEFRMRTKDDRWVWVLDRGKVVKRAPDRKALRMIGTHTDISARKNGDARNAARVKVMTLIATGESLPVILDSIVRNVESMSDWRCAVLLADATGTRLTTGAAPHIPAFFSSIVEGLPIAPGVGSCGSAAHTKKRVISENIATDPRWEAFRDVAEKAGFRACWSEPIVGTEGLLLGTFAAYHHRPSTPSAEDIENIVEAAQIASIAIERKRGEQALREGEAQLAQKSSLLEITLERMEQGVMMVNAQGMVEVCNRRAIELLELPPALMAAKPSFADVLEHQWSTDEFAETPEVLRQFVRGGGILDQPQCYDRKRPNGQILEIQSVPLEGGGVLRTYTDITERKRAEERQGALEEQLREAHKLEAIGTLASGIAHDFNNIMAAILGNVALAREDIGAGNPAHAYLTQIDRAGHRARSLVQQILAFSRQQSSDFASLSLGPLVEETVAMLRSTVGPSVEVRLQSPDHKLAVRGNPTQLQQVLMNLGTNAWQSFQGGAGHIDIGLAEKIVAPTAVTEMPAALAPGAYAHLWVRDDGCGMSEATRARIFEPFFTTKPVGQGTGLGLAVAHGIVDAHSGVITVTSAVGEGSSFDLYLPLIEYQSGLMPLDSIEPEPLRGHGEHVLYVDDDEVMALMVQGLLQRLGYRVTFKLDAREAVEMVRRDPRAVDLVVTDFNMPNYSGLDVARALAQIRLDLPVAISSGYISDELRQSALELGVRGVMQKERTLEELGTLVHSALRASR